MQNILSRFSRRILAVIAATMLVLPSVIWAASLNNRSDQLGTSQAGVATTHTITAEATTGGNVGSIGFLYCTTATGACTLPPGLVTTSATVTSQTGSASGFTLSNAVNGAPYLTRAATNMPAATPFTIVLGNITEPSAVNTAFFVRITTYTASDGASGAVDTGTIAVGTAEQILLTGYTPESLIFCVGVTIGANCSSIAGSSVNFGDFDPLATKSGTSVMAASTNAQGGYVITVNGSTLSSGVHTIAPMAVQAAATPGNGQFGMNLRANTVPAVGADPATTSGGTGTYSGAYGTADQFRYNTGDTVATATVPTNDNIFTSTYVVDIGGAQAAGLYTTTMTYICTAAF